MKHSGRRLGRSYAVGEATAAGFAVLTVALGILLGAAGGGVGGGA